MLKVHSLESFGTHEWPWIRFVVFLQWCMFKCIYCHNPDTIPLEGGNQMGIPEIVEKVINEKPYFWKTGGITMSWWEPLLQAKEIIPLFEELKKNWIHTTIDTNWFPWNDDVKRLVELTDLFLVDMKHINDTWHKKITTQSNNNTIKFIDYLEEKWKDIWLRYVLVPNYSDQVESLEDLGKKFWAYKCVNRIEILPYHTLWEYKWKELWWKYELEWTKAPTSEKVNESKEILEKYFENVYIR